MKKLILSLALLLTSLSVRAYDDYYYETRPIAPAQGFSFAVPGFSMSLSSPSYYVAPPVYVAPPPRVYYVEPPVRRYWTRPTSSYYYRNGHNHHHNRRHHDHD